MVETDVVVVGAGPVGLTTSIALSQHGVGHVLVERHPSTSVAPKARGINARTMEMYRQMGVEDDIRAAGMPARFGGMILWAESLAGKEINRPRREVRRRRGGDVAGRQLRLLAGCPGAGASPSRGSIGPRKASGSTLNSATSGTKAAASPAS